MKRVIQIGSSIWKYNVGIDKFRYLIQAVIWQVRKKRKHSFVKKLHTGAWIKVYPTSAYSSIFYFKWPEPNEIKFIRKHSNLASTFVDVGANVGLFSAHVIDCFTSFFLFEPSPSTFKALQDTCALNQGGARWSLFNIGVADKKSIMDFIDEGGHSGTSRFTGKNIPKAGISPIMSVNVDSLDNLISQEIGDVILKVDVEGFEEHVFNGSNSLFARQQVKLVMFERLGRTNLQAIKNFFAKHNYTIFSVLPDGNTSTEEKDIAVPLINLFAAPCKIFATL